MKNACKLYHNFCFESLCVNFTKSFFRKLSPFYSSFFPGLQNCTKMGRVPTALLNVAFTNTKKISTYNQADYRKYKKEFKTFSPNLRSFSMLSDPTKNYRSP